MANLAQLQHWMQSRIVGVHGDEAAPALTPHQIVGGSAALPAQARMGIYARGYVLRLVECLRADFPVLRALVGDSVFDLFATAYLGTRPSRSYSLFELGAGFADYLEATRPREGAGRGTLEAIPANLARLERAMSEASRAPGPESARDDGVLAATMLLLAPATRLRLPQSVRLLRLDFDFREALAAAGRGARPLQPEAQEVCVAVARSRYRVQMHPMTPARFAWLQALQPDGASAAEAAALAQQATGCDGEALFADLIGWLPAAIHAGLVAGA